MLLDFEKDGVPDREFETCIVGAGAAGLALAHELHERGQDVVLLEGGGASRWERKSQALKATETVGHSFVGAQAGRFRALGGTTSFWMGQVLELDEIDFAERPWVPGSSWPLEKRDLAPYYKRASQLENTDVFLQEDADILDEAGIQESGLGRDLCLSFSRYCPERKFARLFSPLINGDTLPVVLHANVCGGGLAEDRKSVQSVEFRTMEGRLGTCRARNFVFCLGGIESARFILNQKHTPWDPSGLAGRFFTDHIQCFAAEVRNADLSSPDWYLGPQRVSQQYLPKLKLTPEAQREHEVLNVSGLIEYNDGSWSTMRTAVQLLTGSTSGLGMDRVANMAVKLPAVAWSILRSKKDPAYHLPWARPHLSVYCEQLPLSDSRITLTSKQDKTGLYQAAVDWRIAEPELNTIRKYVEIVSDVFRLNGLGEIIPHKDLYKDTFEEQIIDTFHHCGTTRMATSSDEGVVDPNLRLFGTDNAYVCSTSVFPTSGFANPTHTVIALAARLADHLNGNHRGMPDA